MRNRITILIPVIVIAGAAIIYGSCDGTSFGFKKKEKLLFSGTVENREVRVGSKVGGRVETVLVKEGDEVQLGAPIVRFDIAELQTQKAQAEARGDQYRARLARLLSGSRLEERSQARAATEMARANLEA